jgi:hypothetical protein
MSEPHDHDFVFIAGLHRSGTTVLAKAISDAPEASGLEGTGARMDEGQFLQDVYSRGRAFGGVTRWALDDRAYLTEADASAVPDAGERLWRSWSPYWNLDARTLVEKTPLNLTKTRFLQAAFPHSRFVVITRHPITQSLAVHKWSPSRLRRLGYDFPTLVEHWVRAHEAFDRDREYLEKVHVVRFEHLMTDPAAERARLERFLGFALPAEPFAELDAGRSRQYGDQWQQRVAAGSPRAAARALLPGGGRDLRQAGRTATELLLFRRYAREIADRFGTRIAALGYDVEDPNSARADSAG